MDDSKKKTNLLLTGGAGFIGSSLIDGLLKNHYRVICFDDFNDYYDPRIKRRNISEYSSNQDVLIVEGDIRDANILRSVFECNDIEVIVHLAARAGVRPSLHEPLLYVDTNINGTLNLLEFARDYNVERFIFGSSSSVYGINKKVPFSEDDMVDNPISPYAATKKAGELLCHTYHHLYGLSVMCLRFFTVYGPRQRPEMAIHKFTREIDEGIRIPMFGDGTTKRDYTYIDDILDGIMSALDKKFSYEIVNLGDSRVVELKYLISLIENNLGKKALIEEFPTQPGDVLITYADIKKANKLLGYEPKVNIEEGIRRFTEWYQEQKR